MKLYMMGCEIYTLNFLLFRNLFVQSFADSDPYGSIRLYLLYLCSDNRLSQYALKHWVDPGGLNYRKISTKFVKIEVKCLKFKFDIKFVKVTTVKNYKKH